MTTPKINTSSPADITEYDRTTSDILRITEDKLKLKLNSLKDSIETKSNIFSYLGIAFALLVALLTAEFTKNLFGISKDIWQAVFVVFFVIFCFLLIKDIYKFLKHKKTMEDIIKEIKSDSK